MRRRPLAAAAATTLAVLASVLVPTGSAQAVDPSLPPLWKAYQDDFVFGTFGDWSSDQAKQHYRTSSPSNALKLDSQIGRSNTDNLSRQAYTAEVVRIDADTTLTDEQRAAALQKANENVVLAPTDGPGQSETILRAIEAYNASANLPEDEKKVVRAHVLAWHGGQQPNYFFADGFTYNNDPANPNWATPETMLARLDNYIRLMMAKYARYDDIIYSWDVVNEPIDDYTGQIRNSTDAQFGQWGTVFRRPDLDGDPDARLAAESAWVRQAFASARKYTEAEGVDWKLYLNDYQDSNKPYEPKLSQTIKMMKPIYAAGDVDGYGMQGRLSYANPSIEQLRQQMELGLTVADEISISESDIRSDFEANPDYDPSQATYRVTEADASDPRGQWPDFGSCSWANRAAANGNTFDVCNSPVRRIPAWGTADNVALATSPAIMRKQADYVADFMDLLLSYDEVKAYQIDGLSDSATFNRTTGGHLWDGTAQRNEKYSFFAALGAPAREDLRDALAVEVGDESDYTSESWAAYRDVRTAAEAVSEQRVYDLAAVNAVKNATAAVRSSTAALVEVSDPQTQTAVRPAGFDVITRPTPARPGKVAVRLEGVGADAGTVRGGAVVLKGTGPRKVTRVAVVRGGRAVLALPKLKVGTYRITASYSGSADFAALPATKVKDLRIVARR